MEKRPRFCSDSDPPTPVLTANVYNSMLLCGQSHVSRFFFKAVNLHTMAEKPERKKTLARLHDIYQHNNWGSTFLLLLFSLIKQTYTDHVLLSATQTLSRISSWNDTDPVWSFRCSLSYFYNFLDTVTEGILEIVTI